MHLKVDNTNLKIFFFFLREKGLHGRGIEDELINFLWVVKDVAILDGHKNAKVFCCFFLLTGEKHEKKMKSLFSF